MLTGAGNRKHRANVPIPSCAAMTLGACLCSGRAAVAENQRGVDSVARYLAIVMLGTPTRGTSLTVIWNKRYSIWKA